jgi:hypothetical protein
VHRKISTVSEIIIYTFLTNAVFDRSFRGKLVWHMVSKVADVPYSSHFEHKEKWTVLSTSDTATSCILRVSNLVKMLQATEQEDKIRSRSKEDFSKYWTNWV